MLCYFPLKITQFAIVQTVYCNIKVAQCQQNTYTYFSLGIFWAFHTYFQFLLKSMYCSMWQPVQYYKKISYLMHVWEKNALLTSTSLLLLGSKPSVWPQWWSFGAMNQYEVDFCQNINIFFIWLSLTFTHTPSKIDHQVFQKLNL